MSLSIFEYKKINATITLDILPECTFFVFQISVLKQGLDLVKGRWRENGLPKPNKISRNLPLDSKLKVSENSVIEGLEKQQ